MGVAMTSYTIHAWSSSELKFHKAEFATFQEAYHYAQQHGIGLGSIRPTENAVKISGVSKAAVERLLKAGIRFVEHTPSSIFARVVNDAIHVHKDDEDRALELIGRRGKVDLYTVNHQLLATT